MRTEQNAVISAEDYNRVDGHRAPGSDTRAVTIGLSAAEPVLRLWQGEGEESQISAELPLHRALDIAILTCRSLLYFQEAYRFPKLYDPENPLIERIGLQGDAMTAKVCTQNPDIERDIMGFSLALGRQGELLGERVGVLARLVEEMGYCSK